MVMAANTKRIRINNVEIRKYNLLIEDFPCFVILLVFKFVAHSPCGEDEFGLIHIFFDF